MTESVYKLPESYSFKSIWRITFPFDLKILPGALPLRLPKKN